MYFIEDTLRVYRGTKEYAHNAVKELDMSVYTRDDPLRDPGVAVGVYITSSEGYATIQGSSGDLERIKIPANTLFESINCNGYTFCYRFIDKYGNQCTVGREEVSGDLVTIINPVLSNRNTEDSIFINGYEIPTKAYVDMLILYL